MGHSGKRKKYGCSCRGAWLGGAFREVGRLWGLRLSPAALWEMKCKDERRSRSHGGPDCGEERHCTQVEPGEKRIKPMKAPSPGEAALQSSVSWI